MKILKGVEKGSKLIKLFSLILVIAGCQSKNHGSDDLTQYVNPLIGTDIWKKKNQISGPEHPTGFVCPYVGSPFAMTKWTPQTQRKNVAYLYEHEEIQGFRASHHPSGASMVVSDYAPLTILPFTGEVSTNLDAMSSPYRHENEQSKPHYYSVLLEKYQIEVDLTATGTSGILRANYKTLEERKILIDFLNSKGSLDSVISTDGRTKIWLTSRKQGRGTPENFAGYYVVEFDQAPVSIETISSSKGYPAVVLKLKSSANPVLIKTGSSFISHIQAEQNLEAEIPHWDIDKVVNEVQEKWNESLSQIQVSNPVGTSKEVFYTAMYHSLLMPREFSEQGRYYSPYDGEVHEGVSYTDFSLWDTYRAVHPLFLLIEQERSVEMINSLLQNYQEGGWIPKWPNPGYYMMMMGTHADAVIADAYVKGLRGFDAELAWEAMVKNAEVSSDDLYIGRRGIQYFKDLGYVPADLVDESISRTMEFAYDDYCLAAMANEMGLESESAKYMERSTNYRNLMDDQTLKVGARYANGNWVDTTAQWISFWAGETPYTLEVFKQNNTLVVPHDVEWLIDFVGGDQAFINRLDHFFGEEYYYIGDEFSMHSPYLYNLTSQPWKAQKLLRELLSYYFTDEPDGLSGNDDCGQLSSWYMFGAMGFYPFSPGADYYTLSSPLFEETIINLDNGKSFTIVAEGLSEQNLYIQKATLNGEVYSKSYIRHADIMNGGELTFIMGDQPTSSWGTNESDRPISSVSATSNQIGLPRLLSGNEVFTGSTKVELTGLNDEDQVIYTLDGIEPASNSTVYSEPLQFKETKELQARIKCGEQLGRVLKLNFRKIENLATVSIQNALGEWVESDSILVDYQKGGWVYNSGHWKSFQQETVEILLDYQKPIQVSSIRSNYLKNAPQASFYPDKVAYYSSNNGLDFTEIEKVTHDNTIDPRSFAHRIKTYSIDGNWTARYFKVKIQVPKEAPQWYVRERGEQTPQLLVDEIEIR